MLVEYDEEDRCILAKDATEQKNHPKKPAA